MESGEFLNKVAFVTGAGSGIGRATSIMLASRGATVIVADIVEEGGQETVDMISENGDEAVFRHIDVTKRAQVADVIETAVAEFGRLDMAVNNAGIGGMRTPTANYPAEDWDRVIAVNLTGVYYCMKAELPHIAAAGGGAIVNVASIAGLKGFPAHAAYSASKHGVIGLTKSAALEYARNGIRINAICPAFTETAMLDGLLDMKPGLDTQLRQAIPLKRFGTVDEIAEAIVFLCSEKSSFIAGHALPVDGGLLER